jgi:hypothetical protein
MTTATFPLERASTRGCCPDHCWCSAPSPIPPASSARFDRRHNVPRFDRPLATQPIPGDHR